MLYAILDKINSPNDLRKLSQDTLPCLAKELRQFIIEAVAAKEGHLGASLGVVELTIALHYVFNTPVDKVVWDVGHQAYGHKILCGRREVFDSNRRFGGISGFPKMEESEYDTFGVGHSSTSISSVVGMAIAAQLMNNEERMHIAVIGDSSIVSGMAWEGLNHLGDTNANVIIVLNDNGMGIDPSVGALKKCLELEDDSTRANAFKTLFGISYSGPVDGHDLQGLVLKLKELKELKGPRLLHVKTIKGKGLLKAEQQQVVYHAPGRFDSVTGDIIFKEEALYPLRYQDVFGETLIDLAVDNEKIVGITPAMPTGSSLKQFMNRFPTRGFDVGIAEQHAVTFAAGLATQGLLPFTVIYSTFLQRAFDQVIHDVALQRLKVVFCIDRGGLVGEDGATHQGVFDIAYLNCIPNLIIACPLDEQELRDLMFTAQLNMSDAWAIRYPRGKGVLKHLYRKEFKEIQIGKVVEVAKGFESAILSVGTIGNNVMDAFKLCPETTWAHYHFIFVKPLNIEKLKEICQKYKSIVTIEEGTIIGGFGAMVSQYVASSYPDVKVVNLGVPDKFIEHATVAQQQELCEIDVQTIVKIIK